MHEKKRIIPNLDSKRYLLLVFWLYLLLAPDVIRRNIL